MRRLSFVLLLFVSSAFGQSVELPKELKGETNEWIIVSPIAVIGGEPKYEVGPGLTKVDIDKLFGQKPNGVVVKGKPGTYYVKAWNAKGDVASDQAKCTIIIGDGVNPVDPVKPVDPVLPASEWQKAYDKEPATVQVNTPNGVVNYTKQQDKTDLEAVLRLFAESTRTDSPQTWGGWFALIDTGLKKSVGSRLPSIGKLIRAEFSASFAGKKDIDRIGEGDNQKIAEVMVKLADKLKAVNP